MKWQTIIDFINARFPVSWKTGKKWAVVSIVLTLAAVFIVPGSYAVANMPSEVDILAKAQSYTDQQLTGYVTVADFNAYKDAQGLVIKALTDQDAFLEWLCTANNETFQAFYLVWQEFLANYDINESSQNSTIEQLNSEIETIQNLMNNPGPVITATVESGMSAPVGATSLDGVVCLTVQNFLPVALNNLYFKLMLYSEQGFTGHLDWTNLTPAYTDFVMTGYDFHYFYFISHRAVNVGAYGSVTIRIGYHLTFAAALTAPVSFVPIFVLN